MKNMATLSQLLSLTILLLCYRVRMMSLPITIIVLIIQLVAATHADIISIKGDRFESPSINFQGNEITNVALSNVTVRGTIQHLAVDTFEIQSEMSHRSMGGRVVLVDHKGGLYTSPHFRFDDTTQILHLKSTIDFNSNLIQNFSLDNGTVLHDVSFVGGTICNATLENPIIKSDSFLMVNQLSINHLKNDVNKGNNIVISDSNGSLRKSQCIREDTSTSHQGVLIISGTSIFDNDVDFRNNKLSNVKIDTGKIKGDQIEIQAKKVEAQYFKLIPHQKIQQQSDVLSCIDSEGNLKGTNIALHNGWVESINISGSLIFRSHDKQGKLVNAVIEGGSLKSIENLEVQGSVNFKSGLKVDEDALINGNLIVGGSVLGSGPYIDVSDERLKVDITFIRSDNIMQKFHRIRAVSYNLIDHSITKEKNDHNRIKQKKKEIGFIAQNVKREFPELVSLLANGYLGVHYSRFIPYMIEVIKEMDNRIRHLEDENKALQKLVRDIHEQ